MVLHPLPARAQEFQAMNDLILGGDKLFAQVVCTHCRPINEVVIQSLQTVPKLRMDLFKFAKTVHERSQLPGLDQRLAGQTH